MQKKKIFHIGEYFRASLNGILKDSGGFFVKNKQLYWCQPDSQT